VGKDFMKRTHSGKKSTKIPPLHPGEVLQEEFLKELGISQNKLGQDLGSHRAASMRSSKGKEALLPTRPCAWPDISTCPHSFGLDCKWTMS